MAEARKRHAQQAGVKNGAGSNQSVEGIVLVSDGLEIVALDAGAKAILRSILGEGEAEHGWPTLPREILDPLKAQSGPDGARMSVNAQGREYNCRVFTMEAQSEDPVHPVMVLYLRHEMSMADSVLQIGAEYRLTDREQEALMGVAMGLSSKELAERMQISPNTVKVFVRLIMIKMGATTRAGIVGKLIDHSNHLLADAAGRH